MGRHEMNQGAIKIAYGSDPATGYFLSVHDRRISWSEIAPDAVNDVAEKVHSSGGGCYFDLHTASIGFGHKVDRPTLICFWERYGVPAADVEKVRKGQEL
jgi:hypothetical protein